MHDNKGWDELRELIRTENEGGRFSTISGFFNQQWVALVVAQENVTVTGYNTLGDDLEHAIQHIDAAERRDFEVQIVADEFAQVHDVGDLSWNNLRLAVDNVVMQDHYVFMVLVNASSWTLEISDYGKRTRKTSTHSSLSAALELLQYAEWRPFDPAVATHGDITYAAYYS